MSKLKFDIQFFAETYYGTNGSDNIRNGYDYDVIYGNGGDDTIYSLGNGVTIYGGDGDDSIYNRYGGDVAIYGGNGNDTIIDTFGWVSIYGGAGNDKISLGTGLVNSDFTDINAGTGNDTVYGMEDSHAFNYMYASGDGNDVIYNYNPNNKISITDNSYYTTLKSGNDFIVSVIGSGAITLDGAANKNINISGGNFTIPNTGTEIKNFTNSTVISGTDKNDTIKSRASAVTIYGGAGNDYISSDGVLSGGYSYHNTYSEVLFDNVIYAGAGNDTVYVNLNSAGSKYSGYAPFYGNGNSVYGGDGDDSISIEFCENTTVDGGAGNDTIKIYGNDNSLILGGTGNDFIDLTSGGIQTINAGTGNDTISISSGEYLFQYANGDGNDIIYNFNGTLQITGGKYQTLRSGNDLRVSVGSGSVLIKDIANATVSIVGTYDSGDTIPANTLPAGISISNSILTASSSFTGSKIDLADYPNATKVNASALSKAVSIVGSSAANSLKGGNGNDTIYGGYGNDTVSLGGGNDVYIYSGGNDFIQDYTAGKDKIKFASGYITGSSISGSNVVLRTSTGNVTLQNGKDKKITVIDSSGNETTSTYPTETLPAGITVKNSVVTASTKFTGSKIDLADYPNATKVNAASLSKAVSIVGSSANNSLRGGKGADTISGGSGNDTLTGGAGKDIFIYSSGNDTITDYAAGQDKIKLSSGTITNSTISGSNVVLKTSNGNITVQNGKNKKITVIDSSGNETTNTYPAETLPAGITVKNSVVTASTKFAGSKIDLADYPNATKVNAASLSKAVSIVGSSANNSLRGGKGNDTITGGSGNDTLTGGAGKDIFIYSSGNDTITDYAAGQDKIKLSSGTITNSTISGSNVVLKTSNGNITVQNGKNKKITVIDSSGNETTTTYPAETLPAGISINNSVVTASTKFTGNKIDLADYSGVTKVNAASLSKAVSIVGSSVANSLTGGKGADSLYGGAGNDTLSGGKGNNTLTGGNGKDTFIFGGGKDTITDYAAGQDTIKISSGKISKTSYSGKDVIFKIGSGSLTVKNGKGKKITITDSSNKTTTQTYSQTFDLFEDNNFISEDVQLSEITAQKFSVTKIQTSQVDEFKQIQNLLAYSEKK